MGGVRTESARRDRYEYLSKTNLFICQGAGFGPLFFVGAVAKRRGG